MFLKRLVPYYSMTWVLDEKRFPSSIKRNRPKVPENIRLIVDRKTRDLIESFLKPKYIRAPRKNSPFNYKVDIYTKWYRNYFYFCSKYATSGPNALSPFFETRFARLEYNRNELFNLSFMRHNGQWIEIYQNFTLDKCLATIKDDQHFEP
jgi:hypothetical protein